MPDGVAAKQLAIAKQKPDPPLRFLVKFIHSNMETNMNASTFLRCTVTLLIALGLTIFAVFTALGEAPPNDDIANAVEITGLPLEQPFDLIEATWGDEDGYGCYTDSVSRTIWFRFTPAQDMVLEVDVFGESKGLFVSILEGEPGNFQLIGCKHQAYPPVRFRTLAGQSYYFQVGQEEFHPYPISDSIRGTFTLTEIQPPANDNFDQAKVIEMLDFSDTMDISAATLESGEPKPSCLEFEELNGTAWYKYIPEEPGPISFATDQWPYYSVVAAYTGEGLSSLTELACSNTQGERKTIQALAGQPYYFQLAARDNPFREAYFELLKTPPPFVYDFWLSPQDPNVYDSIRICAFVADPGGVGLEKIEWDFGDGSQATSGECIYKTYSADGEYTIQYVVSTFDGRNASYTQELLVRTHDVAITRVTAPLSASARQTRTITVELKNTRYPETVTVYLYKSMVGGFQELASLTKSVPVRTGNRTTRFEFAYTFTPEDAAMGKVVFKAVAVLPEGTRDAIPADNEAVSTPPTRVSGRIAVAAEEAPSPQ